jgi:hypothetical protein
MVALLLVVAFALQLLGSVIVVWEVWEARRRWVEKFRPEMPTGRVIQVATARGRAIGYPGRTLGGTLDERVLRLEASQQRIETNLLNAVVRLEDSVIPAAASEAAKDVQERLEPIIRDTLGYLAGQGERPRWLPWWLGPSFLLAGTVIGGVAALIGATC